MNKKIEDFDLWKKFKKNNDQQARKQLILNHLTLVKYHAGRIKMLVPDFVDQEDLESFAVIGLIDALEKFDFERGIEFKTYASKRIKGAIIDHLRKLDWLPQSVRRQGRQVREVVRKMSGKLGRKPTLQEISREVKIDITRLKNILDMLYSADWVSLYQKKGEGQLKDFVAGNSDEEPENIFQQKQTEELLIEVLEKLPEKEYLVISLFYYEEMSQQEIAEVLNLSPARISQLHKKAVYRLRGFLSNKKLQFARI